MPEKIKERPILFSDEMVRAILKGRKTQARRVVKAPFDCHKLAFHKVSFHNQGRVGTQAYFEDTDLNLFVGVRSPYGSVGDRLWVRESLRVDGQTGNRRVGIMCYEADGEKVIDNQSDVIWTHELPALPPIRMPRWASRITLEITDIRVERLQEISPRDALAEGVICDTMISPRIFFRWIWDSNICSKRKYGWKANPWVWVVKFKRVEL